MKVEPLVCQKCKHAWYPRHPPVKCPACKTLYWDKDSVRVNGRRGMRKGQVS